MVVPRRQIGLGGRRGGLGSKSGGDDATSAPGAALVGRATAATTVHRHLGGILSWIKLSAQRYCAPGLVAS